MSTSSISKPVLLAIIGSSLVIIFCFGAGIYTLVKFTKIRSSTYLDKSDNTAFNNSKDGIEYQKRMVDYISMSDMATNIFPLDTTLAGREKSLANLKDIGIYYWDRNLEILKSLDELSLPENLKTRTQLCKDYCQMNKTCYQLMYKAIDERSRTYDAEVDRQLVKIKEKLEAIRAN